jgi:hypothetical protein
MSAMKTEKPMNNQEGTIFGVSVDALLTWTNVSYLLSVTAALFFSVALWRLSAISTENKDYQLERYKVDAQEKISAAEAIARVAVENSRRLEADAENAKLETQQLKAKLAWRVVTEQQNSKISQILSQKVGAQITVAYIASDPESMYLAIQFSNIFSHAGWVVSMKSLTLANAIYFGLTVPESAQQNVQLVRAALNAASISYATDPIPQVGMSLGGGKIDRDNIVLFVGIRPQ